MKTITTDKMTIGLVEVPTMGFGYFVNNYTFKQELIYFLDSEDLDIEENDDYQIVKDLPFVKTDYTFLSTTKELTEEVAARIVDRINDIDAFPEIIYKDYEKGGTTSVEDGSKVEYIGYTSSIDAFNSLLLTNSLDPSKNYAILEIKK